VWRASNAVGAQETRVGLCRQERGETTPEPRHLPAQKEAGLALGAEQRRPVEKVLCTAGSQHEWRMAVMRENVAHHQGARPVIALDKQLGFAQDANIDASRSLPGGLVCMQGVPFDHVANAAIFIFEKVLVGRGEVLSGIQSHLLVAAAQNQGVQFEEHAQLPEREQLDLAVDQLLDENVSAQHMVDREAVEGFARAADLRIDRCEIRLHLKQRSFNG